MSREGALHQLETAFRHWYWETDRDVPNIGVLVIGLSSGGCDLQYFGNEPGVTVDWPSLFARIIEELHAGRYGIDDAAGVPFEHRS